MSMIHEAEERVGPFRTPRNMAQEVKGSIHDDATASKLGLKGGTVAGSIHMDQFIPMLLDLYGEAWWKTGCLSLMFKQPTVDREEVRAVVRPGETRARLTMFNQPGNLICEGTASLLSPDPQSELAKRLPTQEPAAPGVLRILSALKIGDEAKDIPVEISAQDAARRLETITEPLPAYEGERGVLPPSLAVGLAHQARSAVVASAGKSVGLFGALEVQHISGPLRSGTSYLARTKVKQLSESPKTENVWYDVTIADKTSGKDVANVLFMLRFMKASSPLWAN